MGRGWAAAVTAIAATLLAVPVGSADAQPPGFARAVGEVFAEPNPQAIGPLGWRVVAPHDPAGPLVRLLEGPGPILGLARATQRMASGIGVIRGLVVTSAEVSAISVNGGAPIPTTVLEGLPVPAGVAAYEVPPGSTVGRRGTAPVSIVPLGEGDAPLPITTPRASPPSVVLASATWMPPAHPPPSVCRLSVSPFPGLTMTTSTAITQLRRVPASEGETDTVCAETSFVYGPATSPSLTAYLVIDAASPGTRPASLAGLTPSSANPLFEVSRWPVGEDAVAPTQGGWLLVTGGRDESQRIALLGHLRGTLTLPHRHRARRHRSAARPRA